MPRILLAFLAFVVAGFLYFILLLVKKRRELKGLPGPPTLRGRLWGHLVVAGEAMKKIPPNVHYSVMARYMEKKYNLGKFWYLDLWPFGPRYIVISDPELLARYSSVKQLLPVSPLQVAFLTNILGPNHLQAYEGVQWKALRGIFSPGLSASHVASMMPYVIDLVQDLHSDLTVKAQENQLFELEETATALTVDVIGKVVLDIDFQTRKQPHPIMEAFFERLQIYPALGAASPFFYLNPIRKFRGWRNNKRLNALIEVEVERKMNDSMSTTNRELSEDVKGGKKREKSLIDLAIEAYQDQRADAKAGKSGVVLRADFRKVFRDNVKTFLLAGHDTVLSVICYSLYFLQLRPAKHRALIDELDSVLGKNTTFQQRADQLRQNPYLLNKLEYNTAIVKETLRIFPTANSSRQVRHGDPSFEHFLTDPDTNQQYPLDGWTVWALPYLTGRIEKFFPQPLEFIPERFIPSRTPFPEAQLFTPAGKDAWRVFERGPRNCIGQELAMMELKLVLALLAGEFVFQAEFDGVKVTPQQWVPVEVCDEKLPDGQERWSTVEGHLAHPILDFSLHPRGGMPGRIYWRKEYYTDGIPVEGQDGPKSKD